MAGRTLEEAKAAQRAAAGKAPRPTRGSTQSGSANVATTTTNTTPATNTTTTTNTITTAPSNPAPTTVTAVPANSSGGSPVVINGVSYILVPTPTNRPQQTANLCDHTGAMYRVNDLLDFSGMIAEMGPHRTSLDWGHYTKVADHLDNNTSHVASPSTPFSPLHLSESPFILDTGATCHISPERSDFQNLRTIQPHPIKGLGGTCIYAMGMGTIELTMEDGHRLTLHDAPFVPSSSVRLISVLTLNRDSGTVSCFDEKTCWILKKETGTTVAQGVVSTTRNLYLLSFFAPRIIPPSNNADTTLYAS